MIGNWSRYLLLSTSLVLFLSLCSAPSFAQEVTSGELIQNAYRNGEIDTGQYLVLRTRSIFTPSLLPSRFSGEKTIEQQRFSRDFTLLLHKIWAARDQLSPQERRQLQSYLMRPTDNPGSNEPAADCDGDGNFGEPGEFLDLNGNGNRDSDYSTNFAPGTNHSSYVTSNGNFRIHYVTNDDTFNDADGDGERDPREPFTDNNGDGTRDAGEPFCDLNGDGNYDQGENFQDNNGNGLYDHDAPSATDNDGDGTPDYVEMMGSVFENVYTEEINNMGYRSPPDDNGSAGNPGNPDDKFDVFVLDIGDNGLFGFASAEDFASDNNAYSYMVMDEDYVEFTTPPNQALKVTAAHEFHHSVQFGYNASNAPEEDKAWYMETTSTWMEDEVYDPINDNQQYLSDWFDHPELSLNAWEPTDDGLHQYGSWIWNRHLQQVRGTNVVRSIWQQMDPAGNDDALEATTNVLGGEPELANEFSAFTTKNYLDKEWYDEGRANYPDVNIEETHNSYPTGDQTKNLSHLASHYVQFDASDTSDDKVLKVDFDGADNKPFQVEFVKETAGGDKKGPIKMELSSGTREGERPIDDFGATHPTVVMNPANGDLTDPQYTYSAEVLECITLVEAAQQGIVLVTGKGTFNGDVAELEIDNSGSSEEICVKVEPGTILINKDPNAQSFEVTKTQVFTVEAGNTKTFPGIFAYCIDAHKDIPDDSDVFDVGPPLSQWNPEAITTAPLLERLSVHIDQNNLQGNFDAQGAIWKLTNNESPSSGAQQLLQAANIDPNASYTDFPRMSPASSSSGTSFSYSSELIAPVPKPAFDQGQVGTSVQLDGSESSHPTMSLSEVQTTWDFLSRPSGSSASLTGSNTLTPSFTPDKRGLYKIELTLDDGDKGNSDLNAVLAHRAEDETDSFESGDFSALAWERSGDADWSVNDSTSATSSAPRERTERPPLAKRQQQSPKAKSNKAGARADVVKQSVETSPVPGPQGDFTAHAGDITHGQTTTLSVTQDTEEGRLFFLRRVSSEQGFDFLTFYVDGQQRAQWSGETGWHLVSVDVSSGTHTFTWEYAKDGGVSRREDTAMIDLVAFPTASAPLAPTDLVASASGENIELSWSGEDVPDLQRYRLYRNTTPIEPSDELSPVDSVEGETTTYTDDSTEPGYTYYYRVTAVDSVGFESSLSAGASTFLYPQEVTASISRSFGDASGPDDYRLVAFPGAVDRSLSETISGESGTDWQAWWDDGSDTNFFVKFDGSDIFTFRPGGGFWLTSTQEWTVDEAIPTVELQGDSSAVIGLRDGWNILSNPTDKDVSWSRVTGENGGGLQPLWAFDGSFAQADTFRSAKEGVAYYFLNDAGLDSLTVPYPGSPAETVGKHRTKEQTKLRAFTLRAEGTSEETWSSVRLGTAKNAENGKGPFDVIAPPSRFSEVSLRLKATEKHVPPRQRRWTQDVRSSASDGHQYRLLLRGTPGTTVRLTVQGWEELSERKAALLDPSRGQSFDLRSGSTVKLELRDSTRALKAVLGSGSFVEAQKENVRPDEVTLTSYPNPLRGQGTLEYTLPEPGEVRLVVYDVLGRRVATLESGRKEAGRHSVQLRGTRLSSGVYFGRLQAGDKTLTQKITVVR